MEIGDGDGDARMWFTMANFSPCRVPFCVEPFSEAPIREVWMRRVDERCASGSASTCADGSVARGRWPAFVWSFAEGFTLLGRATRPSYSFK